MCDIKMDFEIYKDQKKLNKVKHVLQDHNKKFILLDGIIGAGKTTLIILLEKYLNKLGIKAKAILEPVDVWREYGALQHFYQDIEKNCYEFQTFTFITRIRRIIDCVSENPDAEIYLLERHIWSDRYIFGELLKHNFGEVKMKMYEYWWDMWAMILPLKADLWVMLDTSVETAHRRMNNRNRGEEKSGVSLEYLQLLWEQHQKFYGNLVKQGEKTLCVNSGLMEKDFINDESILREIYLLIKDNLSNKN